MNEVLRIRGLSHDWSARAALRDISFSLERGRFTALLGPNGAGKSTLISVLTGLIRPAPGVVTVMGHDMSRHARLALARMGVVFQQPTLDLDLSLRANLRLFAALHGLSRRAADARIDAVLEILDIGARAEEKLRAMNGGHRRRMELARALLPEPELLVLDEPTVGLDAAARAAITAHAHRLAQAGTAVFWATHLADEIAPEDDVILLDRGRLRAKGRAAELARNTPLAEWFLRETGGAPCPA